MTERILDPVEVAKEIYWYQDERFLMGILYCMEAYGNSKDEILSFKKEVKEFLRTYNQ